MTRVMGILNVTPDSFSDGGRWLAPAAAEAQAQRMVDEGADVIDVGGQSTRPGHEEISSETEIERVAPVIRAIVGQLKVRVSIDTYKPAVARAALQAGATWLNEVHGFQGSCGAEMAEVAASVEGPVVLMHHDPEFGRKPGSAVERVIEFFDGSLARAERAGVRLERIILDPGIGFFKTQEENLELMGRLEELRELGLPLMLGASRKSVIGHVLGTSAEARLEGTLAASVLAVKAGAAWVRVHDVLANVRAIRMAEAIVGAAAT